EAAAKADPDNRPLSAADLGRMKRTPQVKIIRRALGISQEDFAARYHIPIGTLRDWEQGRAVPDQAARAYLTVIARDPQIVRSALEVQGKQGKPVDKDVIRRPTATFAWAISTIKMKSLDEAKEWDLEWYGL